MTKFLGYLMRFAKWAWSAIRNLLTMPWEMKRIQKQVTELVNRFETISHADYEHAGKVALGNPIALVIERIEDLQRTITKLERDPTIFLQVNSSTNQDLLVAKFSSLCDEIGKLYFSLYGITPHVTIKLSFENEGICIVTCGRSSQPPDRKGRLGFEDAYLPKECSVTGCCFRADDKFTPWTKIPRHFFFAENNLSGRPQYVAKDPLCTKHYNSTLAIPINYRSNDSQLIGTVNSARADGILTLDFSEPNAFPDFPNTLEQEYLFDPASALKVAEKSGTWGYLRAISKCIGMTLAATEFDKKFSVHESPRDGAKFKE